MSEAIARFTENWIKSGYECRTEENFTVFTIESIDIYLGKDLNASVISIYIIDNSENYSKYFSKFIQKLLNNYFQYYIPDKFVYPDALENPSFKTLNDFFSDCKTRFLTFRKKFQSKIPKLDNRMKKPKYRNLDLAAEIFFENVYFEITQEEYSRITQKIPVEIFRNFSIFGTKVDGNSIKVEIFLHCFEDKLKLIQTVDNYNFSTLENLVYMCHGHVKNFSLDLS